MHDENLQMQHTVAFLRIFYKHIIRSAAAFLKTNIKFVTSMIYHFFKKSFSFCVAHSPVRLDIETKFPYFLFLTWLSEIRNEEFRLYI